MIDRVRSAVLGSKANRFDIDDVEGVKSKDYAAARTRAVATAERLGSDVVSDERVFQLLLPELISGGGRVTDFGRGVANVAEDPRLTWSAMVRQLAAVETTRIDLLAGLVAVQPFEVLDELFSGDQKSQGESVRLLDRLLQFRRSPMDGLSDETIIDWCNRSPTTRYPLAAAVGLLFMRTSEKAPHQWTSLTSQLLAKAPDSAAVFNQIVARLHPRSWSGSLSTKLETRLQLLERLDLSGRPELANAGKAAKTHFRRQIDAERRRELEEHRLRGGRFE